MEIILHLGAHKTASTFLQKRLSRSQGRLRRHGISFHGPKSIRPRLAKALGDDPSLSKREQYARRRDSLAWLIDDEEEAGTRRLVLSEEQFLGSLRDMVLGDDFYSAAQDHMAPISDALGGRPVHVVASIRGYADFLASVYGQIVRGWRFMPFDGALRGHFLNQHRGWPELVDEIVMRFPTASRFTLWRYEDFKKIQNAVLAEMAGPATPELRPMDERPFEGPSQTAIDWLHARAAHGHPPDHMTVQAAYEAATKSQGHAPFDPWTADERAYLDSRYRQDLIWLYRLTDCTWLRAPETEAA